MRNWLEIGANIGIVIGLLLVAFQIAQQDEIATTDVTSDSFVAITDHYEQLAGEDPAASLARAMDDPTTLTTRDHVVLTNLYLAEFAKEMRMESLRAPDESVPISTLTRWLGLLSNPYGYAWWQVMGPQLSPLIPKLHHAVTQELERTGPTLAHGSQRSTLAIEEVLIAIQQTGQSD